MAGRLVYIRHPIQVAGEARVGRFEWPEDEPGLDVYIQKGMAFEIDPEAEAECGREVEARRAKRKAQAAAQAPQASAPPDPPQS